MTVLLILNREEAKGVRVMVNVHTKSLKQRVIFLLEQGRDRAAFDLLLKEAEVESYLPPGKKARLRPDVTLIEDLL